LTVDVFVMLAVVFVAFGALAIIMRRPAAGRRSGALDL
jgi:hypothetical protein